MSGIFQGLLASISAKPSLSINGSLVTTATYLYNNSNSPNTLTVTGGNIIVTVSIWGAAGGNGAYPSTGASGAGGFVKGTITLVPGTTYYVYIGQGGRGPTSYSFGNGGLGGWPNGGFGTMGDASGAGGGGMSMMSQALFSTGMSVGDIILISGAGGGSTGYNGQAGAGGGTTGQSGANSGGTGGTQSVGGTYNGAYLTGGNATGSRTSGSDDGGGGGGGYYGGGGGTSAARPGGGGSGYVNSSLVSSSTLTAGSGITAPNPDGTLSSGYANGRTDVSGSPQPGQDGLGYITF
jgi:hypothetical protein